MGGSSFFHVMLCGTWWLQGSRLLLEHSNLQQQRRFPLGTCHSLRCDLRIRGRQADWTKGCESVCWGTLLQGRERFCYQTQTGLQHLDCADVTGRNGASVRSSLSFVSLMMLSRNKVRRSPDFCRRMSVVGTHGCIIACNITLSRLSTSQLRA